MQLLLTHKTRVTIPHNYPKAQTHVFSPTMLPQNGCKTAATLLLLFAFFFIFSFFFLKIFFSNEKIFGLRGGNIDVVAFVRNVEMQLNSVYPIHHDMRDAPTHRYSVQCS